MCSELACPLCCSSNFPNIETFKLNLIQVNSKPIKCPLCNEILLGLDKLTIHLFGHSLPTDEQVPVTPTPPPKIIKIEQKTKQTRIKTVKMSSPLKPADGTFRCEICGFVFADEHLLNLHLSLVHNFTPSNDEPQNTQSNKHEINKFHCHLCSKVFKMKGALRIHIRVAHMRFHDQNRKQINIADYLKNQRSAVNIDQCTIKTEMLSLLDEPRSPEYLQQKSPSIASSPASYIVPSPQGSMNGDQSNKKADKNGKVFECSECKKSFTTKYFLKKHKRLHTGETPYACEICGKTFFFQQSYHKHLSYHTDEKPYECAECGRSFKELSTLHNHERIHSGEKPFRCEVCGKCFRQRVSYLVHSRIHTGALPYKCSECGKGFRYKVSQRNHKCNGVIVKQPGELIQKLMQNSSILPSSTVTSSSVANETAITNDKISINTQTQHESHDLCLEDLFRDDDKLMKSGDNETQLIPQLNVFHDNSAYGNINYGVNSLGNNNNVFPIYFSQTLETINEDSIKDLLGAFK